MSTETNGLPDGQNQPKSIRFTQRDIQLLCNEVEAREFLWKPSQPAHYNPHRVQEAWLSISQKVELPPEVCKSAWNSLSKSYRCHQNAFAGKGIFSKSFPNLSFLNENRMKRKSSTESASSDENPKKRINSQGSSNDEPSSCSRNQLLAKPMAVVVAGSNGGKLVLAKEKELPSAGTTSLSKQLIPPTIPKQAIPITLLKPRTTVTMLKPTQLHFVAQKQPAPVVVAKQAAILAKQQQPILPAAPLLAKQVLHTPIATPQPHDSSAAKPLQNPAAPPSSRDGLTNAVQSARVSFESPLTIKEEPAEQDPPACTQKNFHLESLIVSPVSQCSTLSNKSPLKSELEPEGANPMEIRRPTISAVPTAMLLEKPTPESSPSMDVIREHDCEFNSIYTPPSRPIFGASKAVSQSDSAAQEAHPAIRDDSESFQSQEHERVSLNCTTAPDTPSKTYNLRTNTRMPSKLHNFQLNTLKSAPTMVLKTYEGPRTFVPKHYEIIKDKSGAIAKQLASYWEKTDSTPASPATIVQPLEIQINNTNGLPKRLNRQSLESNSSVQSTHYLVSATSPITVTSQEDRTHCEMAARPQDMPPDSSKHTEMLENLAQKLGALIETQHELLTRMPAAATTTASNEAAVPSEAPTATPSPAKVSAYQWALNTFDFMLNQLTPATAEKAVGEVCELLMAKMKEEQTKK